MAMFTEKEVCPTCNGDKTIVCCSCNEEDECQTLVCPYCQGKGVIKTYHTPRIIGVMGMALVAVLAVFLLI